MDFQSTAQAARQPLAPGQKDGAPLVLDLKVVEREDESRFVMNCVQRSDEFRDPFLDVMEELLANYMVTFDVNARNDLPWPRRTVTGPRNVPSPRNLRGSSSLKDSETHQIVETLASQSLGLVFDSPEIIMAQPIGADDPEKARLLSRLLTAVFRQPNMFRTFYQAFKDSFVLGTAILEMGWEQDSRAQVTANGGVEQVEYKNNFSMRPVDIFDFYPDPSGTRIQHDMEWCVKRFRISKPEASRLARKGVYNVERTRRAIDKGSKTIPSDAHGDSRYEKDLAQVPDEYGIVEGFEFWGRTPLKHGDGANNRVITILEGENVRSSINPFIDGNIPFKEIVVNPMTGRFYGLSPSEVVRFQQDQADAMMMMITDVTNSAAKGPLLVGGGFGGNMNRLHQRGLLDLIECANPDMVKPIPVDSNAVQLAMQEWNRRKQTMREASGAANPLQAVSESGRQTAT
ncbi:MAG: portal protein, partial [Candidatus Thorarchaeota archaeon]